MANVELLNSQTHQDLRFEADDLNKMGHNVGSSMILINEFEQVQREYPIFFRKDPENGQFYACALLGFSKDENLFLDQNSWQSDYVPLVLAKGPFFIGFQDQVEHGETVKTPVIFVDSDHPTIASEGGERLFSESGQRTAHLDHLSDALMQIHQGIDETKNMISKFADLNLIEPLAIDATLGDGTQMKLNGLFTINEETIRELDSETLKILNGSGYLSKAFSIIHSLVNVQYLLNRKNNQLQG